MGPADGIMELADGRANAGLAVGMLDWCHLKQM